MNGEWRDVPGWEGLYQVSRDGRVQSLARTVQRGRSTYAVRGQIVKAQTDTKGRERIELCRNGRRANRLLGTLIKEAFGAEPPNRSIVRAGSPPARGHRYFAPHNGVRLLSSHELQAR